MTTVFRLLVHAFLSFWWPRLSIIDEQPGLLVLDASGFTITASKSDQLVTLNGRAIASFKGIQAIQIQHFASGGGNRRREWWRLSLQVLGRPVVHLGRTRDSLQADIAAAHLSTLIERPVVALSQTGLRSSGIKT